MKLKQKSKSRFKGKLHKITRRPATAGRFFAPSATTKEMQPPRKPDSDRNLIATRSQSDHPINATRNLGPIGKPQLQPQRKPQRNPDFATTTTRSYYNPERRPSLSESKASNSQLFGESRFASIAFSLILFDVSARRDTCPLLCHWRLGLLAWPRPRVPPLR